MSVDSVKALPGPAKALSSPATSSGLGVRFPSDLRSLPGDTIAVLSTTAPLLHGSIAHILLRRTIVALAAFSATTAPLLRGREEFFSSHLVIPLASSSGLFISPENFAFLILHLSSPRYLALISEILGPFLER